ncbi:MAG: BolA family transcriptional regulator [Deltaproteobacteria bacterium]|nr:MAG: BolA family transcriptional regulator [Deltaproteobacteria bacterium]
MGFATFDDAVTGGMQVAISEAIPGAEVEVTHGSGGHYAVRVVSASFAGKSLVEKQRMVYRAIAPFMEGPDAPVHAIDRLETVIA